MKPGDLIAYVRGDGLKEVPQRRFALRRLNEKLDDLPQVGSSKDWQPVHYAAILGTAHGLLALEDFSQYRADFLGKTGFDWKEVDPRQDTREWSLFSMVSGKSGISIHWQPNQITELVEGYVAGRISDQEVAFFLGMVMTSDDKIEPDEIAVLTQAMADSGEKYQFPELEARGFKIVDKHSTGGIGDLVSLILAPLLAQVDSNLRIPMMSGYGLAHTGGTLQKLEAIPGYQVQLSRDELGLVLRDVGCAIFGQSETIAPADEKMYTLRGIVNCVASDALIIASILSKKVAEGTRYLVQDVKTGSGAFYSELAAAQKFARRFVDTGNGAGIVTGAMITDMNQPLGNCAGNKIEVIEALGMLSGERLNGSYSRLMKVTYKLAMELHRLVDPLGDSAHFGHILRTVMDNGAKVRGDVSHQDSAYERFLRMVEAQGGDSDYLKNLVGRIDEKGTLFECAREERYQDMMRVIEPEGELKVYEVRAPQAGYVSAIALKDMGFGIVDLGAGKRKDGDVISPEVGMVTTRALGDQVRAGDLLGVVLRDSQKGTPEAFDGYFTVSQEQTPSPALIKELVM